MTETNDQTKEGNEGAGSGAVPQASDGTGIGISGSDSETVESESAGSESKAGHLGQRSITDARTMRALAHPVRMALLELLIREGELTATKAAELLDDSPGNMSWHLQTLAKYGFVEEAEGGRGRSRPWRVKSPSLQFDSEAATGDVAAAEVALEAIVLERNHDKLRQWWSTRGEYPAEWRRTAFAYTTIRYLTPEETTQLSEELNEVLRRHMDRLTDRTLRPPGSRPVQIVAYGHPIPPTPEGN
jgi:DNA-binding transcriptional ArsR family regulator